jgi:brefeldin A-resistance guanine nucleotide exchange factor 1
VLQNKVNGSSGFLEQAKEVTALKLQQRKRMKRRLTLAAERFNSGQKDWISYAQELELLPSPTATPAATASFLKNTMGLDKKQLGEYLSKGPPDKYPFNGQVLEHYVGLFDFGATPFDEALRMFLLEFRLPGEAQCIDRLMEAFAKQYYEQAKGHHPFVDADSAFVLAFSIIMLNTDLHNPQIREDKRMKLEDFIRNNRSINGGEDLPRPFLESIYECIAAEEIIVHRDHIISMKDGLDVDYDIHWDGILNRSRHVTSATFTPASARRILHSAGVHERDMFASIADSSIKAIRAFFERSYDDILVLKAMHGFYCYSKICTYFSMAPAFNALLVNLFSYGSAFMAEAAEGHHPPPFPDMTIAALAPVNEGNDPSLTKGAGAHRGLLALKAALMLIRRHGNCVQEAWLYLVECIFTLCDLRALPSALSDVDDFSDATGAPLPPSIFATQCLAQAAKEAGEFTSFGRQQSRGLLGSLGSLFWGDKAVSGEGTSLGDNSRAAIEALAQVVDSCRLDQLFTASKDLEPQAVMSLLRALLTCRDPAAAGVTSGPIHPSVGSSRFEAHSVLALELGARVAFANRHRMDIMWPVIHTHIERVLSSPVVMKRLPFLVERVMVTVLRTSIHMLDVESLAPQLLMSLRLLEKLPADMMPPLSCRLGNGLLILIQGNSAHLNSPEPWQIIMTLLSKTAAAPGRGRASAWETISFMVQHSLN